MLEYQYNKAKNGSRISFSEEQLADCTYQDKPVFKCDKYASYLTNFDCDYVERNGCDGGYPTDAFEYLQKVGITTESAYPYELFLDRLTAKVIILFLYKH